MRRLHMFLSQLRRNYNFRKRGNEFEKFCIKLEEKECTSKKESGVSAIVVGPWVGTSTPWFSLTIANLLYLRGRQITIIWDDLDFGIDLKFIKVQNKSIEKVLKLYKEKFTILRLSDYLINDDGTGEQFNCQIENFAALNAIHFSRGETELDYTENYKRTIQGQLKEANKAIYSLLKKHTFDYIFVPGGMYGTSCLPLMHGKINKVRVTTFDGGQGNLLLTNNGVASQLCSIPEDFQIIKNEIDNENFIITEARNEISKRRVGKDIFAYQAGNNSDFFIDKPYVLIALNSSWDSAALGLHNVYRSSTEWIIDSINWVLNNSEDLVVIRQHPAEKHRIQSTNDDYTKIIRDNFGINKRIILITAEENVNSYLLLEKSKFVLVYTSTIGVEAATMGKVVITESNSYYSKLGFIWNGVTKKEYYNLISKATNDELVVSEEQKKDALKCYYISQCCNWTATDFNGETSDFKKFLKRNIDDSINSPEVELVLKSIDENISISLLNHKRNLKKKME